MSARRDFRLALAVGALVAITAVWGSTFPISKDLLTRQPVPDFLALRFLTAALVVGLVRPGALLRAGWRVVGVGVGLGLIYFTGQYLQFVGLQHTAPTVSAFVVSMYVVFTPLLACLLTRKLPSPRTAIATVLATAGVAVMSLRGFSLGWGEMLTVFAASLYAAHILALGRWSRARTAYALAVVQLGTMGLAFLAVASIDGVQLPEARDIPAFLYLAILAGGIALLGQTWAQAHLPAPTVSIIMVLEPVWAGVIGVSVFGERLDARIILGGILILFALVVITDRSRGTYADGVRRPRWRRRPTGVAAGASVVIADVGTQAVAPDQEDGQDVARRARHDKARDEHDEVADQPEGFAGDRSAL
ncbi:Permease of the drug/metabolite transporter (DMT) superfamily [Thermomonospora echinospora]|uniref:Permease of the drug/metabolite transporter (DMT) superfamily n=1 Tax=Thermomonospora echinospora TaxID=1992 RepID=A0A1H6DY37_9ACTN|nr:DMT family transporter [Thermomonospora echinospora]SEG90151.1 Permease of the drug/metabolite transporter (DMT) superfamily [Thermomonospora echinospora]